MNPDLISVIFCHHKGRTLLLNSVKSILDSKEVEFEIIIATSDPTLKEVDGTRVVEIQGGPAHKRNIAYRYAKGDYIAFFDDDIEATPSALFYMLQELKKDKIGMVYGKLLNMEFHDRFDEAGSFLTSTGFLWARAESGCKDTGQYEDICPVLAGKSAACMIRREVFWKVGGFDASYEILGEETDLSWRVWLYGYQVLYVPKSVTFHAFNTRFKPQDFYVPKRVYYNGCKNYLTMLYSNLGKKHWIFPVGLQICVWSFAGIGMLLTGKFEAGVWIFKGIFYFFKNIRTIWLKRFNVQKKIRKISDRELFPIIQFNPHISYYTNRFFHYIKSGRHG